MRTTSAILGLLTLVLFPGTAFALTVTSDKSVTITAQVGSIPTIDPGGGASGATGGVVLPPTQSGVLFSGYAYPEATVTILKLRSELKTVTADKSGYFTVLVPETKESIFTLVATDTEGYRSILLNFPVEVYAGYLSTISDIRFPPTVHTSASRVLVGERIRAEGMALPKMELEFFQGDTLLGSGVSNDGGEYSIVGQAPSSAGEYFLGTRYAGDARISVLERLTVQSVKSPIPVTEDGLLGDFNHDGKVNIIDFSILAYWYGRPDVPLFVDLSRDGSITLKDFSILAYYWTE